MTRNFFRAAKAMIINIRKIKSVKSEINGRMTAELLNGEQVIIARSYVKELKEHFPHLEVYQSGSTRIEVTAKKVSKGSSLQSLKTNAQLVVTFGDSGNDISMFEKSDISYCMAHAPKAVQEAATYVVDYFADAVKHLEKLLYQNSIKA